MSAVQISSRPGTIPRQLSNNQIYVDHEVTVSTSISDAPARRPSTSTTTTRPSFEQLRSNSNIANRQHPGSITSAISRIREANSRTTTMDSQLPRPLSPLPSPAYVSSINQRPSYTTQRSMTIARQYIDAETQSMRELADFLKNKAPPKENFMSIPDPPSASVRDRPSRGMFRRKSKQKRTEQSPVNIKLPDSAVAAKTSDGHWHIAISIPNEYYPSEGVPSTIKEESPPTSVSPRPRAATKNSFGAVTVLKPVSEDRPLSMSDAEPSRNTRTIISRVFSDERPRTAESKALDRRIADLTAVKEIIAEKEAVERELAAIKGLTAQKEHAVQEEQAIREALAVESARALDSGPREGATGGESNGLESHMQHLEEIPRPQAGSSIRSVTSKPRAYIGRAPDEIQRQSSVRSDLRHSGGTAYSERPLTPDNNPNDESHRGHTRNISTLSSVPSIADAVIGTAQVGTSIVGHFEPPNRISSRAPTANLVEVISTTTQPDAEGRARRRTSIQPVRSSMEDNLVGQMPGSRLSAVERPGDGSGVVRTTSTNYFDHGRPLQADVNSTSTRGLSSASPTRRASRRSEQSGRKSRPTSVVDPSNEGKTNTRSSTPSDESSDHNVRKSLDTTRDKRKQRVRAIRSRDVEAQRNRDSIVEMSNTAKVRSPYGQNGKPRIYLSVPGAENQLEHQNTVSKIMHVASTVPDFATFTILGPALGISAAAPAPIDATVQTLISAYPSSAYPSSARNRSVSPSRKGSVDEPNYIPTKSGRATSPRPSSIPRTMPQTIQASQEKESQIEARLATLERNQEIILQSLTSVLALGQSLSSLSQIMSTQASPNPSQRTNTNQSSALPDPPYYPNYTSSLSRQGTQRSTRTTYSTSSTPQVDLTPWERGLLERFERDKTSVAREVGRSLGDIEGLMQEVVGNSRISSELATRQSTESATRSTGFEGDAGPFAGF